MATLSYFPLWHRMGGEHLVSGIALMLVIISLLPLYRELKKRFSTPSVPVLWLAIFALFFTVSRIADEITVIALVGLISSLIASLLYRLSDRLWRQEG